MSLKRCVAGVAVVAVVVALGLVVQAVAAPPYTPIPIKLPDLVVKEVKIERTGGGEFPAHDFTITITNKGIGNAGGTTLGVLSVTDVTGGVMGAGVFASVGVPEIPAGAQATVKFQRQMPIDKAYWVFVADAPVAGKPLGRLLEAGGTTKGKCNNSFVVAYSSAHGNPQVFTNAAAL